MSGTRRRGFTLVEVLVALGITAVLLAALAGAVTGTLRVRDAATERLDRIATARTVLVHLERELASAVAEGFAVAPPPHAALRFSGGDSPGERLAYTLEGSALVRRTRPRFAADGAPGAAVPLVRGVGRFEVRALAAEQWATSWDHADPPRAVAIELVVDGEPLGIVVPVPTGRRGAP